MYLSPDYADRASEKIGLVRGEGKVRAEVARVNCK